MTMTFYPYYLIKSNNDKKVEVRYVNLEKIFFSFRNRFSCLFLSGHSFLKWTIFRLDANSFKRVQKYFASGIAKYHHMLVSERIALALLTLLLYTFFLVLWVSFRITFKQQSAEKTSFTWTFWTDEVSFGGEQPGHIFILEPSNILNQSKI